MYHLEPANFRTEKKQKGTLVKIEIKSNPNNEVIIKEGKRGTDKYNLYIRFRLKNLTEKKQFTTEDLSNDFIQSAFSKIEMTNISFNDKRDFDKADYQDMAKIGTFFNFSKFHFFFVGASCEETVSGQTPFKDCRPLDNNKWKEYIGEHNPSHRICIAYHWNVDIQQQACRIFLKTIYSSPNKKKIFKYLGVGFGISFLAAVFYDIVKGIINLLIWLYQRLAEF